MERGVRVEDAHQELRGADGVDLDAGVDVVLEASLALDDDDRAHLLFGKENAGLGEAIDDAFVERPAGPRPASGAADPFQEAADLALEDDRDRDQKRRERVAEHPAEDGEVERLREDVAAPRRTMMKPRRRDIAVVPLTRRSAR